MARIRSIHPSFFTDEACVSCSPLARLLYIGLWTDADDQGLFEWKPLQLKMRLLPGDHADAPSLLTELFEAGLIGMFEHEGKKFGAIRDFRRYQRPKKPNATHFMPEEWRTFVCLSDTDGDISPPSGEGGSPPVPHQFPTKGENPPQMEDGGEDEGKEVKEEGTSSLCPPASPSDASPPIPAVAKSSVGVNPADVQQAFDDWNAMASRSAVPVALKLTGDRRRKLRAKLAEVGLDGWRAALLKVEASPLCQGQSGDRGWRADIDFLFQQKSWNRLMEGSYDARPIAANQNRPGGRQGWSALEMAAEAMTWDERPEHDDAA